MVEIFQNLMKIINTLGFPFPKGKSVGLIFWIFIGKTEAEVEAPILWPPDAKSWLIGKDPMLGKIEGKRRRGWQMMRWLDSITDSRDMNLSKLGDTVKDREARCAAVHGGTKSWTWLSDWTTTINTQIQEAWCIPRTGIMKKTTLRHIMFKLLKISDKEKNLKSN